MIDFVYVVKNNNSITVCVFCVNMLNFDKLLL